jgi:hypothetical protein
MMRFILRIPPPVQVAEYPDAAGAGRKNNRRERTQRPGRLLDECLFF